jgi:hypothetical protein
MQRPRSACQGTHTRRPECFSRAGAEVAAGRRAELPSRRVPLVPERPATATNAAGGGLWAALLRAAGAAFSPRPSLAVLLTLLGFPGGPACPSLGRFATVPWSCMDDNACLRRSTAPTVPLDTFPCCPSPAEAVCSSSAASPRSMSKSSSASSPAEPAQLCCERPSLQCLMLAEQC